MKQTMCFVSPVTQLVPTQCPHKLNWECRCDGLDDGLAQVTEQILKSFGVTTCSQLVEQRALLAALFSKVQACQNQSRFQVVPGVMP